MSNPQNASLNGDGFRFYRWTDPLTGKETDVLSVTSIRRLCGESFNLVNWQLANLADAALGTMKRTVIGPRGGVKDVRQVWEYPSEFARLYEETEGQQGKMDELRKWLRSRADEPRNIAAVRGTLVHEAIEKNIASDRIERPWVEAAFAGLSTSDRRKMKNGVQDEDIDFVYNAVRQYEDMKREVPFIILAREVQVWNLTAGYAGTFDALIWLLPEGTDEAMAKVKNLQVTADDVERIGGTLVLADWKTSADVHTDQVVQAHAYMSAEFVGSDGIIDHRLTDLLVRAMRGALVHIRPNKWAIHMFEYDVAVVRAFLGSVALARFIATYQKPDALFSEVLTGSASTEDA